jgi:hypothetical protein
MNHTDCKYEGGKGAKKEEGGGRKQRQMNSCSHFHFYKERKIGGGKLPPRTKKNASILTFAGGNPWRGQNP